MPKAAVKTVTASKSKTKKPATKRKANGYQSSESIPLGEILTDLSKQQWKIGPSIGSGGFGDIYCACKANESIKKFDDYSNVVKVEPHGNGPLFVEMHFYMRNGKLADIETFRKKRGLKSLGMPHFIGHGSHELNGKRHRFIVMPRFGKDIWSLFLENDHKLPLHTVLRLAIQMIDVYEYIHGCTYIHGDLKGANMLLGYGKNGGNQVYLVDFGLASHFTTKDFKPDPKKMHNGTIEYTSRDAHQGVPTMRGDLEILAYNLIQWAGGELPWIKNKLLDNPNKVQQAKEDFIQNYSSQMLNCFNDEFQTKADKEAYSSINAYMKYITKLKYDEKPDYEMCRKIFVNGLKSMGKSESGDLEFKMMTTAKGSIAVTRTATITSKSTKATKASKSSKSRDDSENISPKAKSSRKRDSSVDLISPSKKVRSSKSTVESSVSRDKKTKTYNVNLELNISYDANVVVNLKRKPKKVTKPKEHDHNESIQSTDEIPPSEKSFIVQTKIFRKGTRASPRTTK